MISYGITETEKVNCAAWYPQEVVQFVRYRLAARDAPEDVCESLINRCLAPDCQMGGLGCDNMTVTIVCCVADTTWQQVILGYK